MPRMSYIDKTINSWFKERGILDQNLSDYEARPSQVLMANIVDKAIQHNEILLIEAPTGVGKTLAYLIPIFLSNQKTIISTGTKNLQEQLVENDLPFVQRLSPIKAEFTILKGRQNYLCWYRLLNKGNKNFPLFSNKDEALMFSKIEKWAYKTSTGDRGELSWFPDNAPIWLHFTSSHEQCLAGECPYIDQCFVYRAREKAIIADIVIINHHLFLADLSIKQDGYGELLPRAKIFLFDEAHQLARVAWRYFGISISLRRIEILFNDIIRYGTLDKEYVEEAKNIARSIFQLLTGIKENILLIHLKDIYQLDQLIDSLIDSLSRLYENLPVSSEPIFNRLKERIDRLLQELFLLRERANPEYIYWIEKKGKSQALQISPIIPSNEMEGFIKEHKGPIIFTSATLSAGNSFEFFKRELGISVDTSSYILPSPFKYEEQAVLYLPVKLPNPNDPLFHKSAMQIIAKIIELTHGKTLLLFTSFKRLNQSYKALIKKGFPFSIMRQGDAQKYELQKRFKEEKDSVLLATYSFWEGVDVPGETLTSLIIDKLPFDVPSDPLMQSRMHYLKEQGKNPFTEYLLPRAILLLKQGIGRLIRRMTDIGIVVLLDSRIHTRSYGKIILDSLPNFRIVTTMEELYKIWKNIKGT